MSDNTQSENNANSRLNEYRRKRRNFSLLVYGLSLVFILISILQWIPLVIIQEVEIFYADNFYVAIIFLVIALLGITAFIFFEKVRFVFPLNWFTILVIIEGNTLGLARGIVSSSIKFFWVLAGAVFVVVVTLLLIGMWTPHDLTLDVLILFMLSVLFFIGLTIFVIIYILTEMPYADYIFAALVVIIVCIFIMYHAQTIQGDRYAEMRLKDYLLGALIIYHDYVIIFIVIYYLAQKKWVATDDVYL